MNDKQKEELRKVHAVETAINNRDQAERFIHGATGYKVKIVFYMLNAIIQLLIGIIYELRMLRDPSLLEPTPGETTLPVMDRAEQRQEAEGITREDVERSR